ncbi:MULTISPECIES: hypothetical protein [Shewanella]|nr:MULTISPECIES: hypothetical protein [Shewanella]MCK7657657.1 hypothetical protein [Shewanella sp. JNE4-2]MCT8858154.1 hypothetical protein [Shewanella xiamenensis]MDH0451108.1 hypothetical protein [Shewanella sp. GD04112]MDV5393277.1 hypothetical protein [Shewanella xiamenensis]
MNKFSFAALVILSSTANATTYSPAVNSSNQSTVITSTNAGEAEQTFDFDGIKIALTEQEKVLARGFKLTEDEFAQYKYIMNYTPRGFWTPGIDPVTALAASAKTESERRHFVTIAHELKKERDSLQMQMWLTAIDVEKRENPNSNRWKSNSEIKFGFADELPTGKQSLTSVFLDPKQCKTSNDCIGFVKNLLSGNSKWNKTDFYFMGASPNDVSQFVVGVGIDVSKIKAGDISINIDKGEYAASGITVKPPVAVKQDNLGQAIYKP